MKKLFLCIFGSSLLFTTEAFAIQQRRNAAEVMPLNSQAIELQYQTFSKKSSYDEQGTELILSSGESFSVNDWTLKYSKGFYPNFEGTFLTTFRSVKSESLNASASKSGIESLGAEGKYLFKINKKFKSAAGLHLKKAMFTNTHYDTSTNAPLDQVALGDDGLEYGIDYLATYYDKYLNYNFKFGYNKPSSNLSSELVYDAEAVYPIKTFFITAGLGGIYSLKNDPYTDTPNLKPAISRGNSYLFNSINREKVDLNAGVQYAIGEFIIGLKGETILSGKSTDKGNTIYFNVRWEDNTSQPKIQQEATPFDFADKYFAEGFVEKISNSGNFIKINMGQDRQIQTGTYVDVFSLNNYTKGIPIATGKVIKVGPNWSIVNLEKRPSKSLIQIGFLARFYSDNSIP